ncbi:YdbL family protein [Novosphingobium aerophilum]|uniref:YdbL family protein n=1 Tax=Novosphingobium aerophilum TaxID=2839843 RepID=UPI001FD1CFAE|nr:YdbL family protein [Novosphingobium aerophilum]
MMAATLFRRSVPVAVLAATLGAALVAAPALAQRDPAYAAARAAGQVGERMDGYLGFVVPPSGDLKALVEDLNIKRKAVYAQQAQAQHATVEEYAFTAGCQAIARTAPGEKYQAPDGSWATRTSAPPQRDPRCP